MTLPPRPPPRSPVSAGRGAHGQARPRRALRNAAWPVKITIALLVGCSLLVWIIAVLKLLQLGAPAVDRGRLRAARAQGRELAGALRGRRASRASAPGARVVGELYARGAGAAAVDRLRAVADRAILTEGQSARALMWLLAFIAVGAPFIGLFGTVYGIMDAFIRIGAAKTASLPSSRRPSARRSSRRPSASPPPSPRSSSTTGSTSASGDFVSELEASAAEWVALIADGRAWPSDSAIPLVGARPAASGRGGKLDGALDGQSRRRGLSARSTSRRWST